MYSLMQEETCSEAGYEAAGMVHETRARRHHHQPCVCVRARAFEWWHMGLGRQRERSGVDIHFSLYPFSLISVEWWHMGVGRQRERSGFDIQGLARFRI